MRNNVGRLTVLALIAGLGLVGCRNHMPHAFTWPGGGDVTPSHAKPPEGGYYSNWDPFSVKLEVTPMKSVNPVRHQHVLIATVLDDEGKPLPTRRIEWIMSSSDGSVGKIIEVDESGWRNSRGYKMDNHYAVSHTNLCDHVLDLGNDDPSDDIELTEGQTWCVITSPVEGTSHITVYAPGIYDWDDHKVFVVANWYDVAWEFPPEAINAVDTTHEMTTVVTQHSDGVPLPDYIVNYKIIDGPDAVFSSTGTTTASVRTDSAGRASVVMRQSTPAEGVNNIEIDIIRPENVECCEPAVHIATGYTSKTWIGPRIGITKEATPQAMVGEQFAYTIVVHNPSEVPANDVTVTDTLPDGIVYASSSPTAQQSGQTLRWSLGTLAANEQREINVQVRATRVGTFENCADVAGPYNLADRDCASTVVTSAALTIAKTCTSEIILCDEVNYAIVVENTGTGPATNVVVTDRLPNGVTTTDGRNVVTQNIGTLEAGETVEINYTAKCAASGTYTNTATVTGDGNLSDDASCTVTVREPKLSVSKTGPTLRYVGREAVYQITVRNGGDAPARDTVLTDDVPSGTDFVSASDGGQYSGGNVTWQLGTMAPGATKTVNVTVRCTRIGVVRNTATARAFCTDAVASAEMEIRGIAAVLLEVIDVEDPDEVGTTDTYIITVTNQGSAELTNIRITALVQPEAEFVSSDAPVEPVLDGRTVNFAPLPRLDAGARATYRVIVRAIATGDTRFGVRLMADEITGPPVEETESTTFYE